MVVAWDTINFHSLLNQVQLNENKHQNLENNCHFGKLFGTGIVEAKCPDEIGNLVTGPYELSVIHFGVLLCLTIWKALYKDVGSE